MRTATGTGRRSCERGRSHPAPRRRGGRTVVAAGTVGLATGALIAVTLIGCSSPSPGGVPSSAPSQANSAPPQVLPILPSAAPVPSGAATDVVRVEKCWTTATPTHGGQLLVKASSSDPAAHLLVYGSDGSLIGEVQNGGGGRYGGSVMPFQPSDPGACIVRSSAGGTSRAPTGPFQPGS